MDGYLAAKPLKAICFKLLDTYPNPLIYLRYIERANIEELFFVIQTKINANRLRPYLPPAGKTLSDISSAWQELEKAEHRREIRLREELARYVIILHLNSFQVWSKFCVVYQLRVTSLQLWSIFSFEIISIKPWQSRVGQKSSGSYCLLFKC